MSTPVSLWPTPLDWVPDPGITLDWVMFGLGRVLEHLPPAFGFAGYIVLLIGLTRWTMRHVQPVPINVAHPTFQQPGGGLVWFGTGSFRLLLIFGAAVTAGLSLPQAIADSMWHDVRTSPPGDGLGAMGRLSELVGLVCGGMIGCRCQYYLNVLFVVGGITYGLMHVARWVLTG